MKDRGLTVVDDYKNTWKKKAEERNAVRMGNYRDPELRKVLEQVVPQFDK
jgi:hypothetical protein